MKLTSENDTLLDPWPLTALRAVPVVGASLLFAMPLAGTSGMIAAVIAALTSLILARTLAAARVRWIWIGITGIAFAGTGLLAERWIGGSAFVARVIGPATTLTVVEIMTFGCLTFGVVIFLRTLSDRFPASAIFEAMAIVGATAFAFSAHRHYPYSQPQWLADWSFGRGYDPRHVLILIGFANLASLMLLLLPRRNVVRSVAGLGLLGIVCWLALPRLFPNLLDPQIIAATVMAENSRQQAAGADSPPDSESADFIPAEPDSNRVSEPKTSRQKKRNKDSKLKREPEFKKYPPPKKNPEPPPPKTSSEDNLLLPEISIDEAKTKEGNVGETPLEFNVRLSKATDQSIQVTFRTEDRTAQSATSPDYRFTTGVLEIPPGKVSGKIVVYVIGDLDVETDETFAVQLSKPVHAMLKKDFAEGTIVNDDHDPPDPYLTIDDTRLVEGNAGETFATFVVKLSEATTKVVTVHYETTQVVVSADSEPSNLGMLPQPSVLTKQNNATPNEDYRETKGVLTIPPGETTATITVPIIGDIQFEPDETFGVTLSKPTHAQLRRSAAIGVILNDDEEKKPEQDPPPDAPKEPITISINDPKVEEGNAGTTPMRFTVTLSRPADKEVRVDYFSLSRTAREGIDFKPAKGMVTFPAGETQAAVTVAVNGDTDVEPDETLTIGLLNPVGATIKKDEGTGTIINDDRDPPIPKITIDDARVQEGNAGKTPLLFTVKLSEPTTRDVFVNYTTESDTAVAPADFVPAQGTLRFPAGETQGTITVEVVGDELVEPDETLRVRLSTPVNGTIERDTGTGTIENDDNDPPPPKLSVDDAKVEEGNSGTSPLTFIVTLSEAISKDVTVRFVTGGGSAQPGEDYQPRDEILIIPAGETQVKVAVLVNGDVDFEADESLIVQLSEPHNANLDKDRGTGVILNDDKQPPDEPPPDDEFNWSREGPEPLDPAFLVKLHSDFDPVEGGYYFRTRAYSRLVRGRLLRAENVDTDIAWSAPSGVLNLPTVPPQDFMTNRMITGYLIGHHDSPPNLIQPSAFIPHENPAPTEFSAVFDLTAQTLTHPQRKGDAINVYRVIAEFAAGDSAWDEATRQAYLSLPDDPRYRQLSEEIAKRLTQQQRSLPLARGIAIRKWMEENLTYDYNATHAESEDRAASFLFGDRRGYCVHLAHAMTFLLRAQGIPARVASGYRVAPERRGQRGSMLAYSTDEHAWAEIYLQGVGWVVVEAGVKGRIPPSDPQPDPRELDHFLQLIGDLPQELFQDDSPPGIPWGVVLFYVIAWTGVPSVICGFYSIKLWRLLFPLIANQRELPRLGYRALLDRMAEVGLRREPGETWDEFAERIRKVVPDFAALTEAHLRHTYGVGNSIASSEWRKLQQQVGRQVEQSVPRYRRWLGWLNPFSWVGVG